MQLWFMKRKAQVLNFWNEFSSPAKVPKVKEVKICVNMIWKLEFEIHIIGVKASHFLIFYVTWNNYVFFCKKILVILFIPTLYCPPPLFLLCFVNILNWFLQLYFTGLTNDIQRLMTHIVMLEATGCPNDKYLNFIVYNHSNFLSQKVNTL